MNTKILISCLLFSMITVGQTTNRTVTPGGGPSIVLPSLSPQSPNTASLGKYGEVEVNESTGLLSPSIPLFNYKAGKFNIPLSLQYSGNGVRVNQDPTWAGLNWNLNTLGVITREVKDEIDELTPSINRKYLSKQALDSLPGKSQMSNPEFGVFNTQTVWYQTLASLYGENVDSEVDIFNYSFLGYSGSFYLDKNNKVRLIKYDKELEIVFSFFDNNKSMFTIKTPEGDVYYFGGPTASESSRTWVNVGAGSTVGSDYAQNAFYLYQISSLKGGSVYFDYESYGGNGCNKKIGLSETATLKSTNVCDRTVLEVFSQVQNLVKLKMIWSTLTNEYLEFDTSVKNECEGIYQLKNIYHKSAPTIGSDSGQTRLGSQTLKFVKLNYLTINNEINVSKNRFFLEKVEFFDKNSQYVNDYQLTYNSPNLLPKKDSFAQDELGYYNGKNNNTTLLPFLQSVNIENPYFGEASFVCGALADREAFLDYAQIGALYKIKYPTGGETQFEYELPYKGKKQVLDRIHHFTAICAPPGSGYASSPSYPSAGMMVYSVTYSPDEGDGDLIVTTSTNITATLGANLTGVFTHQNKLSIYAIKDNTNGSSEEFLIGEFRNWPTNGGETLMTFNYTLTPGNYRFRLAIHKHSSGPSNIILAYVELNRLPKGFRDENYAGLRIKRVKSNATQPNQASQITRYYYNNIDKLYKESYTYNLSFTNITRGVVPNSGLPALIDYTTLNTSSVTNYYDGNYVYDHITLSYGGDDFENGGKSMNFTSYPNRSCDRYFLGGTFEYDDSYQFSSYINVGGNELSYQNSVLYSESILNKNKGKIKETQYLYEPILNKFVNNIKPYKFAERNTIYIDDYVYMLYEIRSYKYRLISTQTKDFFYNLSNSEIVNTTTNTYTTDKVSLPNSIETKNSLNQINKTNIYYKSDLNLSQPEFGALSAPDIARVPLSEVVKTENLTNNVLLDTKQVLFKNFSGNVLPNIVKAKKGNNATTPLEDRIVFDNYDFYGNPTSVLQKDGSKTRYIYNNNQQVILKIEDNNSGVTLNDGVNASNPCYYQETYPNAMITVYNYDNITNNIISIIDPKCNKTIYTYDSFGRLQYVKDKDGNTLSANEYHYKN